MQISSDTNIWIDFQIIDGLELPFRLSHCFYMSEDAVKDELLTPIGINEKLVYFGLLPLQVTEVEYFAAYGIMIAHPKLSRYDALALSIAKERGYILLTGDKALRKAGESAGVSVRGTLWIFDELKNEGKISDEELCHYLIVLDSHNGKDIRLPASEIAKRLDAVK